MISPRIRVLRSLLEEAIKNIDAGNSNHSEEELDYIIKDLTKLNRGIKRISKREACDRILHCSHFNKKAYNYATSFMTKRNPKTNKEERVQPFTKEEVDEILENNNIELKNKIMYDYIYAATMAKADYLGSTIEDDLHLARYIKDTVDDIDANTETTFRRWMATMIGNGMPIDWYEII